MGRREKYHDVTACVDVTRAECVRDEVLSILSDIYPQYDTSLITTVFKDTESLFMGDYSGYTFCDTGYHDLQHTLDMTLALARLIAGSQRANALTISQDNANIAIICALFHDSGYIRSQKDRKHHNGAEYTKIHVSRGAKFMSYYLPTLGLSESVFITNKMIHFTGYEMAIDRIQMHDPQHQLLGYMLGSADLIAQMSDRCYLEKCRDRLYDEFVIGEIDRTIESNGEITVIYKSAEELLRKTPQFYRKSVLTRLNSIFEGVHEYSADFFGKNLYIDAVNKNIQYLEYVIEKDDFSLLRRKPLPNLATQKADIQDIKEQHKL